MRLGLDFDRKPPAKARLIDRMNRFRKREMSGFKRPRQKKTGGHYGGLVTARSRILYATKLVRYKTKRNWRSRRSLVML